MKTPLLAPLLIASFGLAVLATTGCAEKDKPVETSMPAAKTEQPLTTASAHDTNLLGTTSATAIWTEIKDSTYDTRGQFLAGLRKLESVVEVQLAGLAAKRATMTSATDTKAWDFALKEMNDARSYLRSSGEELAKASPETWNQAKEKVGQAWLRTQEAHTKVLASTTS